MIAFVSEAHGSSGGFGSTIATSSQSHSAGNALAVWVKWSQDGTFPSTITGVANTAGDTFNSILTAYEYKTNSFISMYLVDASIGNGSDVVTVTFNGAFGANDRVVSCIEVTSADASPFDAEAHNTGSGSSANAATTGNLTVTGTNDILLAWELDEFGGAGVGSGFTGATLGGGVYCYEYKVVSATEAAIFLSTGSSILWACAGMSLKEGGSPPPSGGQPIRLRQGGIPDLSGVRHIGRTW